MIAKKGDDEIIDTCSSEDENMEDSQLKKNDKKIKKSKKKKKSKQ
jgi:hypothetical protein